jgi:ankyrin repeat protein
LLAAYFFVRHNGKGKGKGRERGRDAMEAALVAARTNDVPAVRAYLQHGQEDDQRPHRLVANLLLRAALAFGARRILQHLIRHEPGLLDAEDHVEARAPTGGQRLRRPLLVCALDSRRSIFRLLLAWLLERWDANLLDMGLLTRQTERAAEAAAARDNVWALKLLCTTHKLQCPWEPLSHRVDGACLVHVAAGTNACRVLRWLLCFPVPPDSRHRPPFVQQHRLATDGGSNRRPLHCAALHNATGAMRLLLQAKADANRRSGVGSWTPLMEAAEAEAVAATKLLLEAKAKVQNRNGEHETAVHVAALRNVRPELIQLLVGPDRHHLSRSQTRQTCPGLLRARVQAFLLCDARRRLLPCPQLRLVVSRYLRPHRRLLDAASKDGLTPLMYACGTAGTRVMDALLRAGAPPHGRVSPSSGQNQSPLEMLDDWDECVVAGLPMGTAEARRRLRPWTQSPHCPTERAEDRCCTLLQAASAPAGDHVACARFMAARGDWDRDMQLGRWTAKACCAARVSGNVHAMRLLRFFANRQAARQRFGGCGC